jgi:hypothetical protein
MLFEVAPNGSGNHGGLIIEQVDKGIAPRALAAILEMAFEQKRQ